MKNSKRKQRAIAEIVQSVFSGMASFGQSPTIDDRKALAEAAVTCLLAQWQRAEAPAACDQKPTATSSQ